MSILNKSFRSIQHPLVNSHTRNNEPIEFELRRRGSTVPVDSNPPTLQLPLPSDVELYIPEDIRIQIEELDNNGTRQNDQVETISSALNPSYFKIYFDYMHWTGFCPYKGDGTFTKSTAYKIFFTLMSVIAIVQAILSSKLYILEIEKKSLYNVLTAGYFIYTLVLSLWFLRIIAGSKLSAFLSGNSYQNSSPGIDKTKPNRIAAIVLMIVLSLSFTQACWLKLLANDNDIEDIFSIQSSRFGMKVLLWSKEHLTERRRKIFEDFRYFNYKTFGMYFMETLMELIGNIQYYLTKNIMLIAAISLYEKGEALRKKINSTDMADSMQLDELWMEYKFVHKFSMDIEECFGYLFKLEHLDNWLFMAYFLLDCFENDLNILSVFENLVIVIKILMTYALAVKSNDVSSQLKRRLHLSEERTAGGDAENKTLEGKMDKLSYERKVSHAPVGIGRGIFLINETFVFTFLGCVISCFMFFLESVKSKN